MKTITTLLAAALTSLTITASANQEVWSVEYEQWINPADFNSAVNKSEVRTIKDTGQLVWSVAYEQWVNPADFNPVAKQNLSGALNEIENNPPAAGKYALNESFFLNETSDEEFKH
jgi:hypothetical protein